ncbi:hypothetical protein BBJ28_00003384 [Nothophytophthora sp. Chile5]|nr:hypothetical protein BBJ28_00003384 [Nothophytophthora sp. Chile5]
MRVWWRQFVAYLAALLLTKVADLLLLWALLPGVARFATKLFAAFTRHRHLELSLVMLVVPGCCNAVQFWIVDSYLKSDSNQLKNFAAAVDDCETHWIKPPPPARDNLAVKTVSPL